MEPLQLDIFENSFDNFIASNELLGGLILYDNGILPIDALISSQVEIEPFRSKSTGLASLLFTLCTERTTNNHIQKLNDVALKRINSHLIRVSIKSKLVYVQKNYETVNLYAFLFLNDLTLKTIPEAFFDYLEKLLNPLATLVDYEGCKKNFEILEKYVKEVGHDIASSVQACTAKLHHLASKRFQGEQIYEKAREAENEILSAYRVAENLGITVDPGYNISCGTDFDFIEAVQNVLRQVSSEAEEGHNEIVFNPDVRSLAAWGDQSAIESAISQFLINAIKYSFGSTVINVYAKIDRGVVELTVINNGIELPSSDEEHIWNFGYRGSLALERHVNGSGIGLFTVKKIITAHGGEVFYRRMRGNSKINVFGFKIPIRNILKKSNLLA